MKIYVWQNRYRMWIVGESGGKLAPTRYSVIEPAVSARFGANRLWNGDQYVTAFRSGENAIDCACEVFGLSHDDVELRPYRARRVPRLPHFRIHPATVRPPELSHETNDCTVVALAAVTGAAYPDCHAAFKSTGRKDRDGAFEFRLLGSNIDGVRHVLGHAFTKVRHSHPYGVNNGRGGCRLTLREFIARNPVGTFYVCASCHAFAVYDGMTFDHSPHTGLEKLTSAYRVEKVVDAPAIS